MSCDYPIGTENAGFGVVQVFRESMLWRDRASRYRVYVNGRMVGAIAQGETARYTVWPGNVTVMIKLGHFLSSNSVNADTSSPQQLSVRCRPRSAFRAFVQPRSYIRLWADGAVGAA